MANCCLCDERVNPPQWVCSKCALDHELAGKPFVDWPDWVKEMANFEHADRRREAEERGLVFTASECIEAEILFYGEPNTDPLS